MDTAQPAKKLHPLCYEHHKKMEGAEPNLMIAGELRPIAAYACPAADCLVHYGSSHGYFVAAEGGEMQRDGAPRVICIHDGQPMYLAETNAEAASFRAWRCPRCDARRTNEEDVIGGVAK